MNLLGHFARDARPLFWFLLAASLLVRLWGIWYGLPYSYWIDEYHEVLRALELGSGGFNFKRTTKGGFYLLLFFEYGLYYVVLKLAGAVQTTADFARQFVADPTVFYLMGRATATFFGSLTVVAIFGLARKAFSPTAGLLAALFLAFNVLHVDLSRHIGVDVPMTLFATLALYFGLKVAAAGRRSDYLLAALFAALATTTKLPGILLLLPLLIAHAYAVTRSDGHLRIWIASPRLWLAIALFLLVWIATNPGIVDMAWLNLIDPAPSVVDAGEKGNAGEVDERIEGRPNLYLFYLGAMAGAMGWPLFAIGMFSLGYAAWKRTPPDVMLLSYALVNYLVFAGTSSETLYFPRYTLPIIIVVTALAGRTVVELAGRIPQRRTVIAVVAVACVGWPLARTIVNAEALAHPDSRTIAKEWIEANIPAGSRVLIEGMKITPIKGTVPLRETPAAIERRIAYWRTREPKQARYLELQRDASGGTGYELHFVRLDSIAPLQEYVSQGVRYFVVRPEAFEFSRRAEADSGRLIRELRSDPRVRLLHRIEGAAQTPPGPLIEIYGLQ